MKSGTILGPINAGQQPQNTNQGNTLFKSGAVLGPATPIEPVTSAPKKKNKKDKNLLGTVGYIGKEVGKGFGNLYEDMLDTGAIAMQQLGKFTSWTVDNKVGEFIFGKDAGDYENNPLYQIGEKMINDDVVNTLSKPLDDTFNKQSYIDPNSFLGQLPAGVGQVIGMIKSGMGLKSTFISSFGSGYKESKRAGGTEGENLGFGTMNAVIQTATEKLFNGLGKGFKMKGAFDDVISDAVTKKITNKVARILVDRGIKGIGEGFEEVIADLAMPIAQKLTYLKDEDLSKLYKDQDYLSDFFAGSIISGIIQLPSTALDIYDSKKTDKPKESEVIIEDPNKPIETEDTSELVTLGTEINKIKSEIDEYKQQYEEAKKVNNTEDMAIYQSEITRLEQKQSKINTKFTSVQQTSKEVENYKNTNDYKVIENISKELGYKINVISDDVKKSGQGYIDNTNKEITINLQSPKAVNRVFTHEITHGLETTNEYNNLKDYIFNIMSNDEIKTLKTQINKASQKIGKQLTKDEINSEVVAYYIEDNLLQKEEDIIKLRDNNRNIFDKLYEVINNLLVKVKGTTYEKQIKHVQKLYKKALDEKITSETKSKLPTKQVKSEVKKVKKPIVKKEVKTYPEYVKSEEDKKIYNGIEKQENKYQNTLKKEVKPKELTEKEKKKAKLEELYKKSKEQGKVKEIPSNKIFDTEDGQSKNIVKKDVNKDNFKKQLQKTINKGKYSLAGINAKMSDNQRSNLDVAKNMKKNGISPDDIWYATGWEFNEADKDWRFELPDGKINVPKFNKIKVKGGTIKLSDLFDAFELYNAYPELKNRQINIFTNKRRYEGSYNIDTKTISIYNNISLEKAHSILVHEIQHMIQEIEGFASGGSTKDIENRYIENGLYTFDEQTQNDIRRIYRRIAGEVEARNVDARYNMDDYLRSKNRPGITQDTDYKQQFVRPKGKNQVPYKSPNVANVIFSLPLDSDIKFDEKNAYYNGKKVKIGAVNLLDGQIEEVHSHEEAQNADWHHSYYFSQQAQDKLDDGEFGLFFIEDGKLYGTWRDKISDNILNKVKSQLDKKDVKFSLELLDDGQKRKTQKAVRAEIEEDTGLKYFNFNKAKNLSSVNLSGTNPLRVMEKVFGKKLGAELNERFIYPIQRHDALKFRWQNQERQIVKGYGFKAKSKESAAIQKIGEHGYIDFKTHKHYDYTLKDLQKEFPNNWRKIYQTAEKIKGQYKEYLKNTNEVITKYGYDPIKERKDYFMHFRELNFLFETVGLPTSVNDAVLPTNINGLTGIFRPGKRFFASQLERRGEFTEYDAIGGIDRYIQQVGDVLFHTEDIQRLRTLDGYIRNKYAISKLDNEVGNEVSHKEKQLISDRHLSTFVNWLSDYTNAIAGKQDDIDRGFERKFGRTTYKVLNAVKSQVGRNLVGLNPSSALTNFISVTQGVAKTNKLAVMKGMYKTFRNIFYDDGLMSKSTFYTNRLGSNKLSMNWFEKTADFGQSFMKITDLTSAQIIVRSKFEEYKSQGYSDEVAIEKADRFTSKIMAGRTIGEMPTLFNSKLLGIFTQFQLEVNNQMETIFRDTFTEDYAANDNKQVNNPKLYNTIKAISVLAQILAYAWLFNEGFEKITGRRPAFDPIGVIQRAFRHYNNPNLKPQEATLKVVEESLQQIPFAELLVGGGRFPISDALPNPKAMLDNTSTPKKELMKLPLLVLPTGGGQLRKTVQGAELYKYDKPGSYLKDKKTGELKLKYPVKDDTLSKAQNLIFGAYASPEARQYYDNNWRELSVKQTKYYNKIGLPIKQYRKIVTDLNKIKADKDFRGEPIPNTAILKKYRYIERLPIKPKQKQDLYEYLKKN